MKRDVLVVASRTVTSDDLLGALRARAAAGDDVRFHLVVPAPKLGPRGAEAAQALLREALERTRAAGLAADGTVGDWDPVVAVSEAYDPRTHDEIIVSTLPAGSSRWVAIDLPSRIERLTDARVVHVVARERVAAEGSPVPPREATGVLAPLVPLGWGARPPVAG